MLTAHCQFLLFCSVPLAFFLCPTPGCRTCRHPDVEHAETRVLNMSRPGCQTMPFRISVFSFSLLLFSSCAVSPVSLFLVSDTRVSCIPRPGCQTCRDPDVKHVKTRVSYNALPYLRIFFQPSVVSFRAHAHIL